MAARAPRIAAAQPRFHRTIIALALALGSVAPAADPLKLHPENPHYFLFRGKPAVLITGGEHYGAVLNLDFDYVIYLNELQTCRFNLTRIFSGFYREGSGTFGIAKNTLAPASGRFVCPWERSATPGALDGGNKFDLERWDARYFNRLKSFVSEAGQRGVVVEVVLFCTLYDDTLWNLCPLNARNNVQGIGQVGRGEVFALKERALLAAQEAMVRKIVTELKDFDNVYYEICNEPYERGGFSAEWNDHIVNVIAEAEAPFPARHLIAQGIATRSAKIEKPNPHVSIFNFHSARPESVTLNYALNKPIADDETGGQGRNDFSFRKEAWEFMLAGGAVFDHLDFSFTCARPDGTHRLTSEPGGGGPALRQQLQVLKEVIESFNFIRMKPDTGVVQNIRVFNAAQSPASGTAHALSEPGAAYVIYVSGHGPCELNLDLPSGAYRAEWINTKNGTIAKTESFTHCAGPKSLASPQYAEDVALRIKSESRPLASHARTRVSLVNARWHINDEVTYRGAKTEGLLMNVRMVNATFEDRHRPGFDPEANTDEFIKQIPDYGAHGIRAFTLNLQGGMPGYEGALNSGFEADGSLRDCYMTRIGRVIEASDRHGAVVILGCLYQRQDQVLKDESAVRAGVVSVARWIVASGFSNVVLEIANEFGHGGFDHRILKSTDGQAELIRLVHQTAPGLLVSTSGLGDGASHESVARASDFLLVHFNNTHLEEIPQRIASLKRYGKPIVCNEDQKLGKQGVNAAEICVANGASWGLMLENLNQHFPFTFRGAADDPLVYATLKRLTSAESTSKSSQ